MSYIAATTAAVAATAEAWMLAVIGKTLSQSTTEVQHCRL